MAPAGCDCGQVVGEPPANFRVRFRFRFRFGIRFRIRFRVRVRVRWRCPALYRFTTGSRWRFLSDWSFGAFSSFSTPRGQTWAHMPQPTQDERVND